MRFEESEMLFEDREFRVYTSEQVDLMSALEIEEHKVRVYEFDEPKQTAAMPVFDTPVFDTIGNNMRIGYWQHVLGKIENRMIKDQAELTDVKRRLIRLRRLT